MCGMPCVVRVIVARGTPSAGRSSEADVAVATGAPAAGAASALSATSPGTSASEDSTATSGASGAWGPFESGAGGVAVTNAAAGRARSYGSAVCPGLAGCASGHQKRRRSLMPSWLIWVIVADRRHRGHRGRRGGGPTRRQERNRTRADELREQAAVQATRACSSARRRPRRPRRRPPRPAPRPTASRPRPSGSRPRRDDRHQTAARLPRGARRSTCVRPTSSTPTSTPAATSYAGPDRPFTSRPRSEPRRTSRPGHARPVTSPGPSPGTTPPP